MPTSRYSGFTLIELLVVIAIISILAVIGITIFTSVQRNARDATRKADANSISKAYEVKYTSGKYLSLVGSDFSSGRIPRDPTGDDYYNVIAEDGSGFRVCAALEANATRSCDTQSASCFCKNSQQSTITTGANLIGTGIVPTGGPACTLPGSVTTGLISYWKMDEASWNGTVGEVRDAVASNHGQALNSAVTDAGGKVGRGGNFDSTDGRIQIPDSTSLRVKPAMTMALWIKTTETECCISLFSKVGGVSTAEYSLNFNGTTGGKPTMAVYNTAGNFFLWSSGSTTAINDGAWHLVVGTFNTALPSIQIFVDGGPAENSSMTATGTQSSAGTTPVVIAERFDLASNDLEGMIDEVGVWNRVLTEAEVNTLYNSGTGCTL